MADPNAASALKIIPAIIRLLLRSGRMATRRRVVASRERVLSLRPWLFGGLRCNGSFGLEHGNLPPVFGILHPAEIAALGWKGNACYD
jgi:hypothetical protein